MRAKLFPLFPLAPCRTTFLSLFLGCALVLSSLTGGCHSSPRDNSTARPADTTGEATLLAHPDLAAPSTVVELDAPGYVKHPPRPHTGPFLTFEDTKLAGSARFRNYLVLNTSFAHAEALRKELEAELLRRGDISNPLKHRSEAHITVLTPPEYEVSMGMAEKIRGGQTQDPSFLSMAEIQELADAVPLSSLKTEVVCVGRLQKDNRQVFYVVVEAPTLVELRRRIHKLFVEKGGDPQAFDPEKYFPHITLGFTHSDLFHANKDASSCRGLPPLSAQ